MPKAKREAVSDFIALPDSEKNRIVAEIEREPTERLIARSRPLNAKERAQWKKFRAKTGRPKVGKGARTISLTVEKGLLEQADAFAKRHGLSRAQLVARGLRAVIDSAA
jgi:hypothetical protein